MGRRLGQHFLTQKAILDRIASAACDALATAGDHASLAIEIGPGKGGLTKSLLERAEKVVAIEVDSVLVHYLRQRFREELGQGRLVLIEDDVLKVDLGAWGAGVITGNLPYYITSPILEKIFALNDRWTRAVFLVQTEVARRLAAVPGTRDFGYLSVETQLYSRPEILFPIARSAFHPPPRVDSVLVRLEPRDAAAELGISDRAEFLRFASACFRHKRKTLRNNLAGVYGKERIDPLVETRRRAEQLSMEELAALCGKLS